jgi:hypothetical protein
MKFKTFLSEWVSENDKIIDWFRRRIKYMNVAVITPEFEDEAYFSYKRYEEEYSQSKTVFFDIGSDQGKKSIESHGFEELELDFGNDHFSSPLESSAWNKADFGMVIKHAKIEGLDNIPNLEYLAFEYCTFYDLDDEFADDLSRIHQIHLGTGIKFECGLIRFIKSKKFSNLKELRVTGNSELKKACDIINRHLKSGRDVTDCIDELIEAGLKQYAKL